MTRDSSDSESVLTDGVWWLAASGGRRLRATLHFAGEHIRAENENGDRRDARIADADISPRLADVPRKIVFADGTCISADNNDFIDAMIFQSGGGRKSFALHLLESKWTAAAMIIVAAWGVIIAAFAWGAPAAAEFGAKQISQAQLSALGDQIYKQLHANGILPAAEASDDDIARAQKIFGEVSAELTEEGDNFRLLLHHFPPNAFALPGGRIVASDALLDLLTDNELAAVFAHEIGHIRLRHGMRAVLLGTAGGLLAIFGGDIAGISLGAILLNLGYSRDHEREADCFAYQYLLRNNMSAALIGDALEKMEQSFSPDEESDADAESAGELKNEEDGEERARIFRRAMAALSTHPATEERKDLASACKTNS